MNDYKTRLLSEYKELVDRINKLRVFLNKWDNGQLCPKALKGNLFKTTRSNVYLQDVS